MNKPKAQTRRRSALLVSAAVAAAGCGSASTQPASPPTEADRLTGVFSAADILVNNQGRGGAIDGSLHFDLPPDWEMTAIEGTATIKGTDGQTLWEEPIRWGGKARVGSFQYPLVVDFDEGNKIIARRGDGTWDFGVEEGETFAAELRVSHVVFTHGVERVVD